MRLLSHILARLRAWRQAPTLGRQAEDLALRRLRRHGLRLVARNVRNRHGELDLIMQEGELLVVVEVRWRSSARFGGAAASVGPAKQRRLIRATQYWLAETGRHGCRLRFDVVAFECGRFQWLRDAFQSAETTSCDRRYARKASRYPK